MSFCRKIYGFDTPPESEGSFYRAKGKGVEFSTPNDKVAPDAPGFKCESLKPISSKGERGVEGKSAQGKIWSRKGRRSLLNKHYPEQLFYSPNRCSLRTFVVGLLRNTRKLLMQSLIIQMFGRFYIFVYDFRIGRLTMCFSRKLHVRCVFIISYSLEKMWRRKLEIQFTIQTKFILYQCVINN